MQVRAFYDAPTYTVTFVVWDEKTKDAVVIAPGIKMSTRKTSLTI